MSLYAALYGNPHLPDSLRCICGRTFRPERDKETYCSSQCAREDSMRGLLGNDTLYKQHAQRELQQARQPLLERKPKKVKKVPSRLNLQQDVEDTPPTPLPKSARHLPKNRQGQSQTRTNKAPPVPPLVLHGATGNSRDIPPTPPPKSARHLRRIPRNRERSEPPPVPTMPSIYAPAPASTNRSTPARAEPQFRSEAAAASTRRVPNATPATMKSDKAYYSHARNTPVKSSREQRSAASVQPAPRPAYAIYAEPSQRAPPATIPEIKRSNSVPFLQRALDPSTKLGAQYHRAPQHPAIYGPPATQPVIPLSPPPAYASGGIYSGSSFTSSMPKISKAKHGHRPPPIKTHATGGSGRAPAAFVEREIRQSKSANHLQTSSITSTNTRLTGVSQGSGDVWQAVRGLRIDDDVDYRDRFLNRRTPRY